GFSSCAGPRRSIGAGGGICASLAESPALARSLSVHQPSNGTLHGLRNCSGSAQEARVHVSEDDDMSTLSPPPPPDAGSPSSRPDVEIVVPVYNEAGVLETSVRRLHAYIDESCEFTFKITIADNASTDETLEIARRLSAELSEVEVIHLAAKGRGLALRAAWGR